MKTQKRKGFTIVELVIVIAVIAILAAVLIPTFSSVINSANESKDKQLITNLNKALAVDTAVDGKHPTMHSAILAAMSAGYNVEDINASAYSNEILWDSVNDLFVYLKRDKDATDEITPDDIIYINEKSDTNKPVTEMYKFWLIADDQPATGTPEAVLSLYAGTKWPEEKTIVETTVGFDAGFNTNIKTVTYDRSTEDDEQDVVIRTNNMFGSLTINAINDEVDHYGDIGDLDIIAVKKGTYDEFGRVGGIAKLTYGAIKVNAGAEVTTLLATPANDVKDDVILTVEDKGVVGTLIAPTEDILEKLNDDGVNHSEVLVLQEGETDIEAAIKRTLGSVAYVLHEDESRTYYESFDEACNNAESNETVVVLRDYQYDAVITENLITISSKSVTIDLNGKIIQGILSNNKSNSIIKINKSGTLTIQDNTATTSGIGTGALDIRTEFENANPWDVSAAVIMVGQSGHGAGNLIINSGKILNLSGVGGYGIDCIHGNITINGGYVNCSSYCSIRDYAQQGNTSLTMTGGVIEGKRGIYFQHADDTGENTVEISGGTINSTQQAIRIWMCDSAPSDSCKLGTIKISGNAILSNDNPGDSQMSAINNIWYEDAEYCSVAIEQGKLVLTDNR